MNYFSNKEKLAEQAKIHTAQMTRFNSGTNWSIDNTKIYEGNLTKINDFCNTPIIEVRNEDSVTAAKIEKMDINNGKICILNFASYKNPGGMFINGSSAQEECLCHASNLYNILAAFNDFYEWNKKNLNKGMYLNRALYSPKVLFPNEAENSFIPTFDVLTCAAPNFSVSQRYGRFTKEENTEALKSRINFVVSILDENCVDVAILGAYGCGVFAQDPYEVASIFKEALEHSSIRKVIFAIPGGKNLYAFKTIFKGKNEDNF